MFGKQQTNFFVTFVTLVPLWLKDVLTYSPLLVGHIQLPAMGYLFGLLGVIFLKSIVNKAERRILHRLYDTFPPKADLPQAQGSNKKTASEGRKLPEWSN